jgi:CheY-like chemotaxis protein
MKRILLVEDDPFIVDIYVSQLKRDGFEVEVANDGQMGLERVKNNPPDLLLLDILLPGMNGWDVLRELRKDPATKNLKVVVISNLNEGDYEQDIKDLAVIRYLLKVSTTPEEISAIVKEILT